MVGKAVSLPDNRGTRRGAFLKLCQEEQVVPVSRRKGIDSPEASCQTAVIGSREPRHLLSVARPRKSAEG